MGNPAGVRRDFVELEQRRRAAAKLLLRGVPQAEVARQVGVHRQSVSRWAQQLKEGGLDGLRGAGHKGRLSTKDLRRIEGGSKKNPPALGYEEWVCEGPTARSLGRPKVQMQHTNQSGQLLADRAYDVIRERILQGIYSFGFIISRRELAAELGMSQVPINEALARLESEYLIESTARVQTRVRIPTPLDIRGFWAVREALEVQSARLFARSATRKERRDLINAGQQLDQLFEEIMQPEVPNSGEYYRWRCEHMNFHMQIAQCSRMPYLVRTIERKQLLFFNWFYDHQILGVPPVFHEVLARALADQSEEEAEKAMRSHILTRFGELMIRLEALLTMDEKRVAEITNKHRPDHGTMKHVFSKPVRR